MADVWLNTRDEAARTHAQVDRVWNTVVAQSLYAWKMMRLVFFQITNELAAENMMDKNKVRSSR